MKSFLYIAALAASIFLAGCETEIENGEIPAEYLAQAQQMTGDYAGQFERNQGVLRLSMEGNKLRAVFVTDRNDDDLIGGCNSSFGDLLSVGIKGKNARARVTSGTFQFDPGLCSRQILGRKAYLRVHNKRGGAVGLSVQIFKEDRWEYRCGIGGHDPHGPDKGCQWETVSYYLTGYFQRH